MNNNLKYISVDTGKSYTKCAWFENNQPISKAITARSFKSTVNQTKPTNITGIDTLIIYQGKAYNVKSALERVI